MTYTRSSGLQYSSRPHNASLRRGLQARLALTLLGCIAVGMDLVQRWREALGLVPDIRYRVTEAGIDYLLEQREEISLEDWARRPECDLCGQPSMFGMSHLSCVVNEVVPADLVPEGAA